MFLRLCRANSSLRPPPKKMAAICGKQPCVAVDPKRPGVRSRVATGARRERLEAKSCGTGVTCYVQV